MPVFLFVKMLTYEYGEFKLPRHRNAAFMQRGDFRAVQWPIRGQKRSCGRMGLAVFPQSSSKNIGIQKLKTALRRFDGCRAANPYSERQNIAANSNAAFKRVTRWPNKNIPSPANDSLPPLNVETKAKTIAPELGDADGELLSKRFRG